MPDKTEQEEDSKPIWHNPVWVTAIVGLMGAFLTVPEVISDYLSKKQDIKLAEEQTRAQSVKNENDKQALEFTIVNNTLAQQGSERVFVLRYLAKTLDDEDAKLWAIEEVERLDELAQLEADLAEKTNELLALRIAATKQAEPGEPPEFNPKVEALQQELAKQTTEVKRLTIEAGISGHGSSDARATSIERIIDRIIIVPVQSDSIRELKRYQRSNLGFSDVGAHFLITSDGAIETGRSISANPAVLQGSNSGTIGVYINCPRWEPRNEILLCDFDDQQIASLNGLLNSLKSEYGISDERVFDRGEISGRHIASTIIDDLSSDTNVGE